MAILVLLFLFGIPAFLAYLIALFTYKRLVKAGNDKARRNRIIIFVVSFILLSVGAIAIMLSNVSYDR